MRSAYGIESGLCSRWNQNREDDRHSPQVVLGFYTGVRYHPEDIPRALFGARFARVLDLLGYARLMNWRGYGEEALASRDVALWLGNDALTVQYAGETLSRYAVEYRPTGGDAASKLIAVRRPELFERPLTSATGRSSALRARLGPLGYLHQGALQQLLHPVNVLAG
jgi:hypothetical protein